GRRYLLERKRRERASADVAAAGRRLATGVHERRARLPRETRRLPLPVEREDLPVLLSAAYLIAREDEEAAGRVAEEEGRRLDRLGVSLSFTGPWAPYRFVASGGED